MGKVKSDNVEQAASLLTSRNLASCATTENISLTAFFMRWELFLFRSFGGSKE